MGYERDAQRYRTWYAALLRLYPKQHYERFGEGMTQTFDDLLRERMQTQRGLLGFTLWILVETSRWIVRTNFNSALQNRHIARPAIMTGLILLIPLVMTILDRGKPEGDGWHWRPGGFIVMGALLFGAGFLYEFLASKINKRALKIALGLAITVSVLAIWVELAVDGVSQAIKLVLG